MSDASQEIDYDGFENAPDDAPEPANEEPRSDETIPESETIEGVADDQHSDDAAPGDDTAVADPDGSQETAAPSASPPDPNAMRVVSAFYGEQGAQIAEQLHASGQLDHVYNGILQAYELGQRQNAPQDQPADSQDQQDAAPVEPFKLDLDDDTLDPDVRQGIEASIASYFERVVNPLQERVSQLTDAYGNVSQYTADQQRAAQYEAEETAFQALGDTFKGILGAGRTETVTAQQQQARQQLRDEMETIAWGLHTRGKQIPDNQTLAKRAAMALYGDQIANQTRQSLSDKSRNRQTVHKPTNRENSLPKGDARALAGIADFLGKEAEDEPEDDGGWLD